MAIIQVEEAGQNTIAVCAGANARWSAADIDVCAADIARAKITLLQREVPHEANLAVAKAVRAAGGTVLLDPAPVGDASRMADLIAVTDIISPTKRKRPRSPASSRPISLRRKPPRAFFWSAARRSSSSSLAVAARFW